MKLEIFAFSVALNVISLVAVTHQNKRLKAITKDHDKVVSWAKIMSEIHQTHFANGGVFIISKELKQKIDAFEIFVENDLF